jgi:hypothetical protein
MGVLENLKDAALVAQKVGQIALHKQILQAEDEVREITREKRRLEDKVETLEKSLKLRAAMTYNAPVYYQKGDATPFCAPCYEKDGHAIHLIKDYKGSWFCRVCKNQFGSPEDDGPSFGVASMNRG